jgi:hypothetical protein
MAKNIPAKIQFLNGEIEGLKARMVNQDNGAQHSKLEMLSDIRDDYRSAAEKAIASRGQPNAHP